MHELQEECSFPGISWGAKAFYGTCLLTWDRPAGGGYFQKTLGLGCGDNIQSTTGLDWGEVLSGI